MSIFNSIATTFKGIAASAKQHSPEILIVGGIIGGIGTVVLACRATLKADEVVKLSLIHIWSDCRRIRFPSGLLASREGSSLSFQARA